MRLFYILTSCLLAGVWAIPGDPYIFETDDLPRLPDGTVNVRLLPSIGNGHLATNVFSDTIYVNGLYNGRLGNSYRARIQNTLASDFEVDGCTPDRLYRLDTRRAVVEEIVSCQSVTVTYRTYAHAAFDRVMVTEIHLERAGGGPNNNITVNRVSLQGAESNDFAWSFVIQENPHTFYKSGTTYQAETDESGLRNVHIYFNDFFMPYQWVLPEGVDRVDFLYLMAIDTDQLKAKEDFERGHDVDQLMDETIKGAFYYIYSSLPSLTSADVLSDNKFYGLSPGGLPNGKNGSDYYGHVFWDMETWMYPAITLLRPDLAKAMLSYRIQGIGEAMKRAASGGYEGARWRKYVIISEQVRASNVRRFPWESAFTGVEVTPDICPLCRENQQHITGDIAFAARQLVSLVRDYDWLSTPQAATNYTGNDFIVEMARFWASRPTFNTTKNLWEINEVMPPDEHQEHARNSIYTNLVANYAVSTARWTSCLIYGEATAQQMVPSEWLDKMRNLVFLFNSAKRYHEEYEGFDEEYESGNLDPRGIKQADVVLLGYPLLWNMPDDVKRNDLELYEPITNPDGPAMTWSVFSTSYLELGDQEKGDELFDRSFRPYVREPFKVWTEVQSGVGAVNFITGAGGYLQGLIFGYGGIRIHPQHLEVNNQFLPPNTDSFKVVGVQYQETKFDLEFTEGEMTITCTLNGQTSLVLEFADGLVIDFPCNAASTFPKQSFKVARKFPSSCPLPRDDILVDYS